MTLRMQKERISALSLVRAEMETISAELKMWQAFILKLRPATKIDYIPGDAVRVYKESIASGAVQST